MAYSREPRLDLLTRERDLEEGSEWVRVRRSSVAALSNRHHAGQTVLPAGVMSRSQLMQNRDKVEGERFEEAVMRATRSNRGAVATPRNPHLLDPAIVGSLGGTERSHPLRSRPSLAEVASSMSHALSIYRAFTDQLPLEVDLEEVNTDRNTDRLRTSISSDTITSNPAFSKVLDMYLEERDRVRARINPGTETSNPALSRVPDRYFEERDGDGLQISSGTETSNPAFSNVPDILLEERDRVGARISSRTKTSNPALSRVPDMYFKERDRVGARISSGTKTSNPALRRKRSMYEAHADPSTLEGDFEEMIDEEESELVPISRNSGALVSDIPHAEYTSASGAVKKGNSSFQPWWFREKKGYSKEKAEIGEVDTEPPRKQHCSGLEMGRSSSGPDERLNVVKSQPSLNDAASSRFEKAVVSSVSRERGVPNRNPDRLGRAVDNNRSQQSTSAQRSRANSSVRPADKNKAIAVETKPVSSKGPKETLRVPGVQHLNPVPEANESQGTRSKKRRQNCPLSSCPSASLHLRKHVLNHFPLYFRDLKEFPESQWGTFVKVRVRALHLITKFLVGEGSTLDELVDFVNSGWQIRMSHISKFHEIEMGLMIAQQSWPKVVPSLEPINTPAALCHWRPLAFLVDHLSRDERQQLYLLGEKELQHATNGAYKQRDDPDFLVLAVGGDIGAPARNIDCLGSAVENKEKQQPIPSQHSVASPVGHVDGKNKAIAVETKPLASLGSKGMLQGPGGQHLNPVLEANASRTTTCRSRTRKKTCPIRNCRLSVHSMKSHVLSHFPKYFKELHAFEESHGALIIKVRVMGLHLIAKFLVGEGSTLYKLVEFVNSNWQPCTPHITPFFRNEMDVMITQQSWPKVVPSLEPINTPAALCHWRVLAFLFNQLSQLQREILFLLEKTELQHVTEVANKQAPEPDPLPEKVDVRREPAMPAKTPPVLLRGFDAYYQPNLLHAKMQMKMQASGNGLSKKVIPGRKPDHMIQLEGGVKNYCDPEYFSTPHFEQVVLGGKPDSWKIAVGIPPKMALTYTPYQWDCLVRHLRHPKVKAISGIGLDFTVPRNQWNGQEKLLERQLINGKMGNILVLHFQSETRDHLSNVMYQHALHLVKQKCFPRQRVHLHCFCGGSAAVKSWTQAFPDCYFGISGLIRTFNQEQLQALKEIPKNRLLLETNSPNGQVHPDQEYNTPDFLGDLGKLLADALGVSLAEVMSITLENGLRLYK